MTREEAVRWCKDRNHTFIDLDGNEIVYMRSGREVYYSRYRVNELRDGERHA